MDALSIRIAILIGLMVGAADFPGADVAAPVGGIGSPPDAMIFYVARGAALRAGLLE